MRIDIPNLTLLNQFVVTAQEAGISKAAKRLRISQPALSKNIHKLEAMLETPLFERHANGVTLTAAGRILLDRSLVIVLEYKFALQDIRNALSEQESTIRIGAGAIWSSTLLPMITEKYHAVFPEHRLLVQSDTINELMELLRLGQTDILAGPLVASLTPPGFVTRVLARTELVVFASKDHPLVTSGEVQQPERLSDYPFVMFMESRAVSERLTVYMKRFKARPPRILLETPSLFSCAELVRTGKYLFFGTRLINSSPIGYGMVEIPLPETIHAFNVGLTYREGLDRIPHYHRLLRIMQETLADLVQRADQVNEKNSD